MLPVIVFCFLKTDLPVLSEITFGSKEEESNNFADSSLAIEGITKKNFITPIYLLFQLLYLEAVHLVLHQKLKWIV